MSVVHCKREPYDVYIGRGRDSRSGEPGRWGNPFSHRPSRVAGVTVVATREEAIEHYRRWLWEEIESGRVDLAELASLHGKALGCWCSPSHAMARCSRRRRSGPLASRRAGSPAGPRR